MFSEYALPFADLSFEHGQAINGSGGTWAVLGLTLFSVIMLLIMMNLMIAIMSEAIEEVKRIARARWCFEQVRIQIDLTFIN